MPFQDEQLTALREPLPHDDPRVKQLSRSVGKDDQGNKRMGLFPYLEGYDLISKANEIFGFHSWAYRLKGVEWRQIANRTTGEITGGFYFASVTVTVMTPDGELVERDGDGVGVPAVDYPDAHETAIKGASTDALKRALRTFGDQFGNSLADKTHGGEQPHHQESQGSAQAVRSNGATVAPQGSGEARTCPSCDQPMVLRNGTTRDGRPYSAWFCTTKCGQKPIWIAVRQQGGDY